MKHLRVHGTAEKWSAKLVEEYDIDDKHHKQAIRNLIAELIQLAVIRNYYIDRDTLLALYDKHIGEYK
jgi:hypothetical protein